MIAWKLPRTAKEWATGLVLTAVLMSMTLGAYFRHRSSVVSQLVARACGVPLYTKSAEDSINAIRKLGSYHSREITQILIGIVQNRCASSWMSPTVTDAVIQVLESRKDPESAAALASLLQPHEQLAIREVVATALQKMPCNTECATYVLHYLERIEQGEPNLEDQFIRPNDDPAAQGLKTHEQELYSNLEVVLKRNEAITVQCLVTIYGLGTPTPSSFALKLVSESQMRSACPQLDRSSRAISAASPEFFRAPRQELQTAMSSLGCP